MSFDKLINLGLSILSSRFLILGNKARLFLSCIKSLGLADFKAMRDIIRSMSQMPRILS